MMIVTPGEQQTRDLLARRILYFEARMMVALRNADYDRDDGAVRQAIFETESATTLAREYDGALRAAQAQARREAEIDRSLAGES